MLHLTVIAGPNGSGKSTLINQLRKIGIGLGNHINADDIARENNLNGEKGSKQAQKLADTLRDQCLERGEDFSFETVMSHPSKVEFMQRAKATGYYVTLAFVCTEDPAINLRRIHNRVMFGGHDVPADRVIARYHRTLELLPDAIKAANHAVLFDNSSNHEMLERTLKAISEIRQPSDGKFIVTLRGDLPAWCQPAIAKFQ